MWHRHIQRGLLLWKGGLITEIEGGKHREGALLSKTRCCAAETPGRRRRLDQQQMYIGALSATRKAKCTSSFQATPATTLSLYQAAPRW